MLGTFLKRLSYKDLRTVKTLTIRQSIDLPQVDHGGGRARGRERATRATKSRVVDLCPLREFKSH